EGHQEDDGGVSCRKEHFRHMRHKAHFSKLNRRAHLRPKPHSIQAANNMSVPFSVNFRQMNTSPIPQPQSNLTAQKAMALAEAMANARFHTSAVNGSNIARSITAVPRTATPDRSRSPQKVSNQGSAAAIELSNSGLLVKWYCSTNIKKATGSSAFFSPI